MSDEPPKRPPATEPYPLRYCPSCGASVHPGATTCTSCHNELTDRRIGMTVAGRYRIDALIGEGGMGRVYRATHLVLGEPVVVKFLLGEWSMRADGRARFRREAVVLARLRHPGIVSVHDFGEEDGLLYLVMELVVGETLAARLRAGPLPLDAIGDLFAQILQVLDAAHGAGIIHRDMKPENVMLLDAGDGVARVKVLDFGMALVDEGEDAPRLTTPGAVQGTPLYMSPEQCHGTEVGPATDVYAIGVMLYEALTRRPPFAGKSSAEVLAKQMFAAPPPFAEVAPALDVARLPPGLEPLVMRALAKEPAGRPTVGELRAELARALKGTDAAGVAAVAAGERVVSGGQSRDDRALPRLPLPFQSTAQLDGSLNERPRVLLLAFAGTRGDELRDALAVNGIDAEKASADAPPPHDLKDRPVRAVLIAGDLTAVERTRHARASALGQVPLLVVDLVRPSEIPELIRAGASDVAMSTVADGLLCRQVWRLIRRGR